MAARTRRVTRIGRGNRLPQALNEFAILAESLEAHSFFEEVDRRLPLSRRNGYCAAPVLAFLLAFFTSGAPGLRPTYEMYREWWSELAALCGLKGHLPSGASMSRALSKVSVTEVFEFGLWLLQQSVDHRPLLKMEGAVTIDCQKNHWHALHYDPTIEAFRQRALPEGDDLPEAERRLDELAAPGYLGRKRGEVQAARGLLQHSGTGLWLSASIGPGNGQPREDFARAVHGARKWADANSIEPAKVVVFSDGGVGGNVPNVTACREAEINYGTRLSRYERWDEAASHLSKAEWHPVEDSVSGPAREATEFGQVRLTPKPETRRADGRPYEPVWVRGVISRFASPAKRGAGFWRDGYQYELFATDLPQDGWPASAVVTGYYGRCGQENRFAQEDHELRLDRVFSYKPGGQLLATLVGQFLWNLRTCRGAQLLGAIEPETRAEREKLVQDTPSPVESINAAGPSEIAADESVSDTLSEGPFDSPRRARGADLEDEPRDVPNVQKQVTSESRRSVCGTPRWLASLMLIACLNWSDKLRPGWRFAEDQGLICPEGQSIPFYRLDKHRPDSVTVRFRACGGTCTKCLDRTNCTSSLSRRFRKEVQTTVSDGEFEDPDALMDALTTAHSSSPKQPPSSRWRPPCPVKPVTGSCQWPRLLPTIFRKRHRAAAGQLDISIDYKPGRRHSTNQPIWLATSQAAKQHRRHTYSHRFAKYRLPEDARLDIRYAARTADASRLVELQ